MNQAGITVKVQSVGWGVIGLIILVLMLWCAGCSEKSDSDDGPSTLSVIDGIWEYQYIRNGQTLGSGFMAFAQSQIILRTWTGCSSIGHFLTLSNSDLSVDANGHVTGDYYAQCSTSATPPGAGDTTGTQQQGATRYSLDVMWESEGPTQTLIGQTIGHYSDGDSTYDFYAVRDVPSHHYFQSYSEAPGTCTADATTLCLNNQRFKVTVAWRDYLDNDYQAHAQEVPGSEDTGLFWFTQPDNWEMLIKVIDGCSVNDRYWVFTAASTDVEYSLNIVDTKTGQGLLYQNPAGTSSPAITDTEAFATCP